MTNKLSTLFSRLALGGAALLLCAGTQAASQSMADAQARYHQQLQACKSAQSQEDPVACRKEAVNALAAARRGALTSESSDQYLQNAVQRCNAFKNTSDRDDCRNRILKGTVQGSVAGGGVLIEGVTVVPPQ
ncbi:MAG: hypothetical protein ABI343_02845 [Burkholderiaceae bacterium]